MPFDWNAIWKEVILYLPRIGGGLIVFFLFWLGARLAKSLVVHFLISRFSKVTRVDRALVVFCAQSIRLALIVFGAIMALGTLGIDVSALVAGVGLSGFALGFAFKDIISNALSGILIIIYRPFTENDRITMAPHEGVVREVNLRYTILEADESQKRIFIPNSLLFTNAITVVPQGTPAPPPPAASSASSSG